VWRFGKEKGREGKGLTDEGPNCNFAALLEGTGMSANIPWYLKGVDASDKNHNLLQAVHDLDFQAVEKLLTNGANAAHERRDEGTWGAYTSISPLHIAIRNNKNGASRDLVRLLLEAGANLSAAEASYDWRGCGSSCSAWEMASNSGDVELVRLCLKHGGDPNVPSTRSRHSMRTDGSSKWFMLHTAVESQDKELVKVLLEGRANVDAVKSDVYHNERGYNQNYRATSLHIAAADGNVEIVEMLLAAGADINAVQHSLDQVSNPSFDGL